MRHAPQPEGSGTRFTCVYPHPEIEPVDGWALGYFLADDSDRFSYLEYVARGPVEDVLLPVIRFAFTPTQARFEFLVRNGFAQKPARHCAAPWEDRDIDAAIAAECRAVAA